MRRTALLALLALVGGPGLAVAQPAAGAAPAPGLKQFGVFYVRCVQAKSMAPCDLYEERIDQQGRRVLGFSIGFTPAGSRYILQVATPLGVALEKGVVISDGKNTTPALPYRRCDQSACFVETAIDRSLVDVFAKMGKDAKVKIVADGGKNYDITFSFDGFTAAHENMVAENRAKATTVESATDAR